MIQKMVRSKVGKGGRLGGQEDDGAVVVHVAVPAAGGGVVVVEAVEVLRVVHGRGGWLQRGGGQLGTWKAETVLSEIITT